MRSYQDEWYYVNEVDNKQFPPQELLCGSTSYFDVASGISYRCDTCMAVVGSIGMPPECKELYDMEKVVNKLSGKKNGKE